MILKLLLRNRVGFIGLLGLTFFVLMAFVGPLLVKLDDEAHVTQKPDEKGAGAFELNAKAIGVARNESRFRAEEIGPDGKDCGIMQTRITGRSCASMVARASSISASEYS